MRSFSPVDAVVLGLLGAWQLWYLWLILKKSLRIGAVLFLYCGLFLAAMIWAGISPIAAGAVTVLLSVVAVAAVATQAPAGFRVQAGALGLVGLVIVGGAWAANGMDHWRAVAVVVAAAALTAFAVVRLFDLGSGARALLAAEPSALFKYTYWSQRAIDAIIGDNPGETGSRFRLALDQIHLPSIGGVLPEFTVSSTGPKPTRHDVARKFEETFDGFIADAASLPADFRGGLVRGRGTMWGTFFGADQIKDSDAPDPAAFITIHLETDQPRTGQVKPGRPGMRRPGEQPGEKVSAKRVAFCLFGSKDNFDGYVQDSHPQHVRGWASSATLAVFEWLAGSKEWDEQRWGETVGSVACKHANYQAALSGGGLGVGRGDYEKSLALRQDDADWLAFAYHVETEGKHTVVPFDKILIGRPIWIRSRHLRVRTTDEFSVDEVGDLPNRSRRRTFRDRWRRRLGIDGNADGWPVYLYRLVLRLRRIAADV